MVAICVKIYRMNQIYAFLKPVLLVNLYLIPLTLFVFTSKLFFPYVTSKALFFYLTAQLAFFCWAVLAIKYKEYRFKPNFLFYAMSAFVLVTFIADLFGLNFYKSFWSNSERMDGFLTTAHVFIYFATLLGALRDKKAWGYYARYILGAITLVGLFSVVKEWESIKNIPTHRLSSSLGNPIYMATISVMGIFLSGFFFFKKKLSLDNLRSKIMYLSIASFLLYVIFLTGTRGALVGVSFGLLAFCISIFFSERENNFLKYSSLGGVIVFVTFAASFFFLKDDLLKTEIVQNSNLLKRTFSISSENRTTRNRLATWEIAIDGFKERPLLGFGQEGYEHLFSKYYKPETLYDAETWFDRSHNAHLDKLAFSGIFGFLAYLAIYFFAFRLIWTKNGFNNRERSMLTALLVGHLVQNSFVFESVSSHILITAILAYIGFAPESKNEKKNQEHGKKDILIMLAGSSVLIVTLTFFVFRTYDANNSLLKALLYKQIAPTVQLQQCPGLLSLNDNRRSVAYAKMYCHEMEKYSFAEEKKNRPFLDQLSVAFKKNTFVSKEVFEKTAPEQKVLTSLRPEELQEFDILMGEEVKKIFERYPDDNKLNTYYGIYLLRTGRVGYAEDFINRAYELGPKKFSNINTKVELEIKKGNIEEANSLLSEALGYGPNRNSVALFNSINPK